MFTIELFSMKNLYPFILITVICIFHACKSTKSQPSTVVPIEVVGAVKISDTTYIDFSEITNLSYKSYLATITIIYGVKSPQYTQALPISTIWSKLGDGYSYLDQSYQKEGIYDNYPAVGISYGQALAYSKWRSNMVFFGHLIRNGVLPDSFDQTFSIESYFKGEYKGYKPDPRFSQYVVYSLPSPAQFVAARKFAASYNKNVLKTAGTSFCDLKKYTETYTIADVKDKTEKFLYSTIPLDEVNCPTSFEKTINHLTGNVRELTNNPLVTYGLSFRDSLTSEIGLLEFTTPNCYTGFRNVAEIKTWKF